MSPVSNTKKETYVSGNNGAAYTAKFAKEPLDSTVKVFKMNRDDMPVGDRVPKPKGDSFRRSSQRDKTLEAQLGKDERKHKLEQGIMNGTIRTIEDACEQLEVTTTTVRRYLKELDRVLVNRAY